MRALWQKAKADILGRRWQSLLVITTIGAAAALLYVGLLTLSSASAPLERLIDRTQGPHAYFFTSGSEGTRELANRLSGDPEVTGVHLRSVFSTEVLVQGRDENAQVMLHPVSPGPAPMMNHLIVEGRELETGQQNEAVLGVSLARYFGIAVGDQIHLALPTGPRPLTVVGLSSDSLWCSFPTCSPANLYILPETFADLTEALPGEHFVLGVRLVDPNAADQFVSKVVKEAGAVRITTALSWLTMQTGSQLINGLATASVMVFALTAMAAAALITVNLVGSAVLSQFREIATLKVLGFTAREVQLLFAGQNLLLGSLGAVVGVGAGQVAAGRMLAALVEEAGDPSLLHFRPAFAGLVIAVVAGIAVAVGLLAAWPAVVLRPAAALRDGFAAPRTRTPWPVRLLAGLRAPAPVILGVKDVTARPGRALLTTLSLILCIITISISAGVGQFSRQVDGNLDVMGMPYDIMAVVKAPYSVTEAEAIARTLPGVTAIAQRTQLGAVVMDRDVAFRLEGVEGDWTSIPWQLTAGRLPHGADEIMLATGIAQKLGVQAGDRLDLRINGEGVSWSVVGIYRFPLELGQIGLTNMEAIRRVLPDTKPNGLILRTDREMDPAAVRQALLEQSDYRLSVTLIRTFITGGFMRDTVEQAGKLSLLLAMIAALSMLNTAMMNAREQVREVGIRKAMGMTPVQVLTAQGAGGAWLGLIGVAVGVPGGLWLHSFMTGLMASSMQFGPVPIERPPVMILLLLVGGIGLAILAALPAATWASRIVTAQALRAE